MPKERPPASWFARLMDQLRVDTAIVLVMLATLMAHPQAVIGFLCDLIGVP